VWAARIAPAVGQDPESFHPADGVLGADPQAGQGAVVGFLIIR
jgi:hypothetical protein